MLACGTGRQRATFNEAVQAFGLKYSVKMSDYKKSAIGRLGAARHQALSAIGILS